MSFEQLNLIEPILKALAKEGYEIPTPIQSQSIPIILNGKDLLGCAQTGTGKTAAFTIPILQQLYLNKNNSGRRSIKALIVTPTRELAIQIGECIENYGAFTGLRHTVIFGGVKQTLQVGPLRNGVDILVATPGRLLDLIGQGLISLDDLSIFVLDEADRMLDMGFIHDIKKLLKIIPEKRQSLLFSATMPDSIMHLTESILKNPAKVSVTPVSSAATTVQQNLYFVDQANKYDLLVTILKEKKIKSTLIFTRTKHGADKVVKHLHKCNITAQAIHGNKSQNARQNALAQFKDQKISALVATDIAARGIDIDELSFVINFEIPNVSETYIHRIGRTGRAGTSGEAISFCDIDEVPYLRDIQKLLGFEINEISDHAFPALETVPDGKFKPKPPQQRTGFIKNHAPKKEQRENKPSSSPSKNTYGKSSFSGGTGKKKFFRRDSASPSK